MSGIANTANYVLIAAVTCRNVDVTAVDGRNARDDLELSGDVLADAVNALYHDVVGRVDADERGWIVDDFTLVQTATYRIAREDSFFGHVVDVAAGVAVDQATANRISERHWASQQLHQPHHSDIE